MAITSIYSDWYLDGHLNPCDPSEKSYIEQFEAQKKFDAPELSLNLLFHQGTSPAFLINNQPGSNYALCDLIDSRYAMSLYIQICKHPVVSVCWLNHHHYSPYGDDDPAFS